MPNWDEMLVSIAIAAAKNCVHVFEKEYPNDDRPRKALEAAEKWLHEPTMENRQLLGKLEMQLWRSSDWESDQASLAAQACALAARAARHPLTSAMHAIECERCANGIEPGEYTRKWLYLVLRRVGPLGLNDRPTHTTSKISSS
jgi:immunity protein 5 of polymorphic toxin system